MTLDQMTMPNGYTLSLAATPSSTDRDGKQGVDKEGTVKGRGNIAHDAGLLLVTTGAGAYIGTLAGAVINGAAGKGALIGGGIGAGAGILAILTTRGPEAELPRGTTLDVVFDRPLLLDGALLPSNDAGHLSSASSAPLAVTSQAVSPIDDRRARWPHLPPLFPFLRF
jgi:hypothetical protein